jgi:lactoylglutathione lyase
MLKPAAFEHVGLVVTDMDRSLRFYTEGLGLELLRRRGAGREGFAALKVGQAEFNVFCNPDLPDREEPERVHHLCLAMDCATIHDLIEALHAARIDIDSGPVKRSDGIALFVRDPDGMHIELLVKD